MSSVLVYLVLFHQQKNIQFVEVQATHVTHLEYLDEKMEKKLKEIIARKREERRAKDERIDDMVAKLYATRMGRTSCAMVLIELEMLGEATQVLEGLLGEDDEVVETWYLLGCLNRIRAMTEKESGYEGNVRFYLGKAWEVHKKNPTDDADMMQHIDEILAEVGPGESIKEEGEDDSQVVAPPSDGGSRESETSTSGGQFN